MAIACVKKDKTLLGVQFNKEPVVIGAFSLNNSFYILKKGLFFCLAIAPHHITLFSRLLVRSVGRAPVSRVGGRGFKTQPDQHLRSLNIEKEVLPL